MKFPRTIVAFALLSSLSLLSADTLDAFLEKARAQLGSAKALDDVESIHYKGVVISPSGEQLSELELYFDKPNRQLLREMRDGMVNQTAVNGYEGYVMSRDTANPSNEVLQVLRPAQVKRLMSNAIENLNFFEGPNKMRGGEIVDEGLTEYNGKPARKIRFSYPLNLHYTRFFDPETGELLATQSSDGLTMVEKDALTAGGIKFPQTVETYDNTGALLRTVKFTVVNVNEKLEPGLFDFPE